MISLLPKFASVAEVHVNSQSQSVTGELLNNPDFYFIFKSCRSLYHGSKVVHESHMNHPHSLILVPQIFD